MLKIIMPGKISIDYGPIQMTVLAEKDGEPLSKEIMRVEQEVDRLLISLVNTLNYAKTSWPCLIEIKKLPNVLKIMIEAVSSTKDERLTPMAAVAGAFADLVANYLVDEGATKVIVNNGGDIAIRLKQEKNIKVGISPRLSAKVSHIAVVEKNSKIGGIATSGLGGRGFTLGIAEAVTIFAKNAVTADALATYIANNTNINSPKITRCLAKEIDINTDIPDLLVTTNVGKLSQSDYKEALEQGLSKVIQFENDDIIIGAIIFCGGIMRIWPEDMNIYPIF